MFTHFFIDRPILSAVISILIVLGGAVACIFYLGFTLVQFFDRLRDTVGIWHFYTGMIKAPKKNNRLRETTVPYLFFIALR